MKAPNYTTYSDWIYISEPFTGALILVKASLFKELDLPSCLGSTPISPLISQARAVWPIWVQCFPEHGKIKYITELVKTIQNVCYIFQLAQTWLCGKVDSQVNRTFWVKMWEGRMNAVVSKMWYVLNETSHKWKNTEVVWTWINALE